MAAQNSKVNEKNLRELAWKAGYRGVVGLAKAMNKSRVTVHRAAKRPKRYGPTYQKLEELLLEK
jgi:hypothetical protein